MSLFLYIASQYCKRKMQDPSKSQRRRKNAKGKEIMNKDELMKLEGVTSEIADAVLKAYEGYVPHDRFNEVNEVKKTAEAAVAERV